jgi:tetratricopeptide (TPR) repeat protein
MSDPRKLSPSEISIDAIENGKILFAEERLEEAREQYLFAINANPNSDEAYGGLTNIYISMALKEPELKQRQKLFEGLSEQVRKLSPKKDLANRYIECSNPINVEIRYLNLNKQKKRITMD